MDKELQQDRKIAELIPLAWTAFFETFGRLTPVQRSAIPVIAKGENALVVSATASGKTEAVCAPLIERGCRRTDKWTILYISPTRALVNDLYQRLDTPLSRLSLSIKRRTGDHHDSLGDAHVILTTPESFDSLLCRGRQSNGNGHILANVSAVVIDEIHLLDGNPRGEQTRWCIERLRRLRKQAVTEGWSSNPHFQLVGLSATISEPQQIVDRFIGQATTIQIDGGRSIDVVAPTGVSPNIQEGLLTYISSLETPEKILVFTNSRKRADDLTSTIADQLEPFGYQAHTHHGSLSVQQRRDTEDAVKSIDKIVIFSTSTLEIGIDIGDIDLVVLDGPAPDAKSLLQRIGRGNRRTDKTRLMTFSGSYLETIVNSAMILGAEDGWLGINQFGPEYAVAKQQTASYIYQSPRRSRSRTRVEELIDSLIPENIGHGILSGMLESEELIEEGNGLRLGDSWMDKASSGQIHSNIESMPGLTVVDESSGATIATGLRLRPDGTPRLNIGGNFLEVRKWHQQKVEVRKINESGVLNPNWGYTSNAWFRGSDQPQAVKRYLGVHEDEWPVVKIKDKYYVFHFGGTRRQAIIQLAADNNNGRSNINEWYLELHGTSSQKPEWVSNFRSWQVDLAIENKLSSLEHTLGRPRSNDTLPTHVRCEEIREWLHIDQEAHCIRDSVWNIDLESETSTLLIDIVNATSKISPK